MIENEKGKKPNIIFTIAAKNYLASAITLGESVMSSGTDAEFIIILADEWLEESVKEIRFPIIEAKDLGISSFEDMAFKYDIVEFSTSIKPFAIQYLFDKGYEMVMYLDPDIYVYQKLNKLFTKLRDSTIILTPHSVDGIMVGADLHYYDDFLLCGVYNLGFVGMKNNENGRKIIEWWSNKLERECVYDKMYFVDQKWMELCPAIFDGVKILREKDLNIAWWNFRERKLTLNTNPYVDNFGEETAVSFIHFSNFKPGYPYDYYEKRGVILDTEQKELIALLYEEYEAQLIKNGYRKYFSLPYKYGSYENGEEILLTHRRLYKRLMEDGHEIFHPFSVGTNSFYYSLRRNRLLVKMHKKEIDKPKNVLVFDRRHPRVDCILIFAIRTICRIVGIENYEKLLRYIKKYYTLDQQLFLLKRK